MSKKPYIITVWKGQRILRSLYADKIQEARSLKTELMHMLSCLNRYGALNEHLKLTIADAGGIKAEDRVEIDRITRLVDVFPEYRHGAFRYIDNERFMLTLLINNGALDKTEKGAYKIIATSPRDRLCRHLKTFENPHTTLLDAREILQHIEDEIRKTQQDLTQKLVDAM